MFTRPMAAIALAVALSGLLGCRPTQNGGQTQIQQVDLSGVHLAIYPGAKRLTDAESSAPTPANAQEVAMTTPDPLDKVGRFYMRKYGGRGAYIQGDSEFMLIRRQVNGKILRVVLNDLEGETRITLRVQPDADK